MKKDCWKVSACGALCLVCSQLAVANTLRVGVGETYPTVSSALAASSDEDVILIADGTYVLDAELQLDKSVTFKSVSGDRSKCIISGDDKVPLVYIANTVNKRIVFDSITLTKGAGAANRAAGITMLENNQANMQLFVTNCVISYCKNGISNYGGAAILRASGANANISFASCEISFNEQNVAGANNYGGPGLNFWYQYSPGTLIENCDFHHNTSTQSSTAGGGLRMMMTKSARVRNCRFYENKATNGGGVYIFGDGSDSSVVMSDCEIYDNEATTAGGGVMYGTGATIADCNIHDNTAKNGGGTATGASTYGYLTDCQISNNTATSYGGGSYYQSIQVNPAQTVRCTYVGNEASSNGGAVYTAVQWFGANNEFKNCLFRSNAAKNGGAVYFDCNAAVSGASHVGVSEFENCTFTKNTATGNGGCFYLKRGNIELEGRFTCANCAFIGNLKAGTVDEIYADKDDFFAQFSFCATDAAGKLPVGNVDADETAFTDFAGDDYTPIYAGVLYDAAEMLDWMDDAATDLNGNRRLSSYGLEKNPDIGAIEWQASSKKGVCAHEATLVLPAVPATCETDGLSPEGLFCKVCESTVVEQHVVPALGHDVGEETVDYLPTVMSAGRKHCVCSRCGQKQKTPIAALGLDYAISGTPEILAKEAALQDVDGVVYVGTDGNDDTGTGKLAAPFATIAGALAKTTGAVEVRVLHGVYTLTAAIDLPGSRTMKICAASGDRNAVVLDANHACPAVVGKTGGASVDLCDLTVINAQGAADVIAGTVCGGALDFDHISRAVVKNCAFVGCVSPKSAAIGFENCTDVALKDSLLVACSNLNAVASWNFAGGVYFKDCGGNELEGTTFVGCYCANKGGAASGQGGNARRCRFYDNYAKDVGGAFYNFQGYGDITGCRFEGNVSESNGGAIYEDSSDALNYPTVISDCMFLNNRGTSGGAVYLAVASLVRNSYFDGNASTQSGGAIFQIWKGSSKFEHSVESCTFVNNMANGTGAGFCLKDAGAAAGSFGIIDAVFYGNRANGVVNAFDGLGALVSAVSSTAVDIDSGLPEGNLIIDATDFADVGAGDFTPSCEGRICDTGTKLEWMDETAADALGNRRVSSYGLSKKPDIGAIEWQACSKKEQCEHAVTRNVYGYGATCEDPGLTDGLVCEICESVLKEQQVIAALGHAIVEEHAYDATVVSGGRDDARCTREGCGHCEKTTAAPLGLDYAINGTADVLAKESVLTDADNVFYVATSGNDETGTGKVNAPFRTIARAIGAVADKTASEIRIFHGVYTLDETIEIPANKYLTVRSAAGDRNAVVINANWVGSGVCGGAGVKIDLCDLTIMNAYNRQSDAQTVFGGACDFRSADRAVISNCVLACSQSDGGAGGVGFRSCAYCALLDSQIVACTNLIADGSASWRFGGGFYLRDNTSGNIVSNCVLVANCSKNSGGGGAAQDGKILDCRFYDNYAVASGGGARFFLNMECMARCLFDGNATGENGVGGGVWDNPDHDGSMISNCVFRNNLAASGGGIYWAWTDNAASAQKQHEIVGCAFEGNKSTAPNKLNQYGGGAIYIKRPNSGVIRNCKLIGNEAAKGGGIYLDWDSWGNDARRIDFRNLLVSRNMATENGAGVYVFNSVSNWVMDACTIVDNVATPAGAANFYVESVYNNGSNGALTLINTILGGGAPNLAAKTGIWSDWAKNFNYLATDSVTLPVPESANNLLGVGWFGFVDAATCDYGLLRKSPLVDRGSSEGWMKKRSTKDLAGGRRIRGASVDIGACEYQLLPGLILTVH